MLWYTYTHINIYIFKQIEIIYSIFYYISIYYWISYKEYYSLKKIPYTGVIYFFKNFMHDFRNTYTIIHRNHDIEMRLLEWNKDNQFEIYGSIGKIHKSLYIVEAWNCEKSCTVFFVETLEHSSYFRCEYRQRDEKGKRRSKKCDRKREILCKAKFSREFFLLPCI